ncbi:hypothetical protein ACF0H5_009077 [Mactra antiquata]
MQSVVQLEVDSTAQVIVHNRATSKKRRTQFACRHCDDEFQEYSDLFQHVVANHPLNQQGSGGSRAPLPNERQKNDAQMRDSGQNKSKQIDSIQQRSAENLSTSHQHTDESALNNGVLNRSVLPNSSERYDVLTFFGNIREQVRSFLEARVSSMGGIKFNLV